MTAFGPYKDKEIIDFRELGSNSLFVISGDTGAGKTTIFDGICFALYGTASGQDRENSMMLRSDFAKDDTHTSVELVFELHGKVYRVFRQLGHVKHGNKTKTGEKCEFLQIKDNKEIACVDRQIVSEIDKKVEILMGLTQDQFKQIVMLPQGEFRKLLTSETENKEDILRRIFKTEPYKQISERLRDRKDKLAEAFNQEKQKQETYVQNIHAALPEREGSELFRLFAEEHYNINQVLQGLEKEALFYQKQIIRDQEIYEKVYKDHDEKLTAFHRAKTINERFEELKQKQTSLQELTEQVPYFKKKEKQLADAERAGKLEAYEKQAADVRLEEQEKTRALHDAEKAKQRADEMFKNVSQIYQEEENKQDEREKINRQLDRLREYLPAVKEMDEREKRLQELASKEKASSKELQVSQENLKEKKKQAENYRADIKAKDEAVSQLYDKQQQLSVMGEKVKTLQAYRELTEQLTELEKTRQHKRQELDREKKKYTRLEDAWLGNQAHILAVHLHDGEACPVCGSYEHPVKAIEKSGSGVSKEQLEAAKEAFNKADAAYRNTNAEINAKIEQRKQKEAEVADYGIYLVEATNVEQQLKEEGKELKADVYNLQSIRQKLTGLKAMFEQLREACTKLEKETEQCEQVYNQLKNTYAAEYAVYRDRLQNIPEEVRQLSALEKQIKETEAVKDRMVQAWEAAKRRYEQAKESKTKTTSNLENAEKQLQETKAKSQRAEERFTKALADAGFASELAYQQAKLSRDELVQLKEVIEQFKQNISTTKQQVKELQASLKNKQQTDLAVMQQQLEELKQAYEAALNKRDQSKKHYEEATTLSQRISEVHENVQKAERKLQTIADLYDVIRGQNSKKVSFERYLQIAYLERIIEAANHRLRLVSNGQFLLMRSDRQEARGKQSGLGLDVHDAYTGQTRDVKTLSGGEKFNASLCLALGMSDVIQSFQGNISIKTMFIDEGFGSLDEESLHKAIEVLIDLQKAGRMIGVISHVQELKAIFPAVLEVQKTKEGHSQTRFINK